MFKNHDPGHRRLNYNCLSLLQQFLDLGYRNSEADARECKLERRKKLRSFGYWILQKPELPKKRVGKGANISGLIFLTVTLHTCRGFLIQVYTPRSRILERKTRIPNPTTVPYQFFLLPCWFYSVYSDILFSNSKHQ